MSLTLTTPPAARSATLAGRFSHALSVARTLAAAIPGWLTRLHANRQLRRTMARMSDHDLSDIGLMRQDIMDVASLSLTTDVGEFFARRAGDRRRR